MKKFIFLCTYLFICFQTSTAQTSRFSITAGYGLAGSFFVRSYDENPFPNTGYKTFYKKNFVGSAQNISLSYSLRKNWELNAGLNFQHFTRRIKSRDTLSGVLIDLNHDIHHRNYFWFAGVQKLYLKNRSQIGWGISLYYLRPHQEEVEISQPGFFQNLERNYQTSNLEEAGSFAELMYEYEFQPKVHLGIKTQFYMTLSAMYAESITLFPYVKIKF